MSTRFQQVPLERLPGGPPADSILGSHLGTTDYLLTTGSASASVQAHTYQRNEDFWRDVIGQRLFAGMEIVLRRFQLMDWFPRAPGLYYTEDAEWARKEAFKFLHPGFTPSPIRGDHGGTREADHRVVFTPEGKVSMLQGGIGAIRLKPMNIFGEAHWLMSGSSDGVPHTGVPLAVPRKLLGPLLAPIHIDGAVTVTITGELEFVPDPFTRLFDHAIMVPKLLIKVTGLGQAARTSMELENSVAVSFVSDYQGPVRVYATYVTFCPNVEGSFEKAVNWMKREYVEGGYRGRIITDFDQTRTIFPEASLALSNVMDRLVSEGALRESVALMHATGSVDSYLTEIDKRKLLPREQATDRTSIFISYAHAAEKSTGWVERIRTHLNGLTHASDFEVWDDSRIEPGQEWKKEIEQAISRTRVAVLVLTADFLASEFIRDGESAIAFGDRSAKRCQDSLYLWKRCSPFRSCPTAFAVSGCQ